MRVKKLGRNFEKKREKAITKTRGNPLKPASQGCENDKSVNISFAFFKNVSVELFIISIVDK